MNANDNQSTNRGAPAAVDSRPVATRLPKLCGGDIELGNFISGISAIGGTGSMASRALLACVDGLPGPKTWGGVSINSHGHAFHAHGRRDDDDSNGRSGNNVITYGGCNLQDWGRKFLPSNGGCIYIDLDHLEICLPEVRSAANHVACYHAMLRIVRQALHRANARMLKGQKIHVLVNNSDGLGNSYGGHLNLLISRETYDAMFNRKYHRLLFLASHQASSIVLTGLGKVGAENGLPPVAYQISQRADYFESLEGPQTTFERPIVNSRDEALCGPTQWNQPNTHGTGHMARLHVIFYDAGLAPVACYLKIGCLQIITSMLEAGFDNPSLQVDDAIEAVHLWSHDPTLQARARMANGEKLTAVELQLRLAQEAAKFIQAGGCDDMVPDAPRILALWQDTLEKLHKGDFGALTARLDWVLKLSILQRAMEQHPELTWDSPQIKHLDQIYSSLDQAEGLYWLYEKAGAVERVVSEEQIDRFVHEPPDDTRAWTRATILRALPTAIDDVDWDCIRFRLKSDGCWPLYRTLRMANPLGATKREMEPALREAKTLDDVIEAVEQTSVDNGTSGSATSQPQSDTAAKTAPLCLPAAALAVSHQSGPSIPVPANNNRVFRKKNPKGGLQ